MTTAELTPSALAKKNLLLGTGLRRPHIRAIQKLTTNPVDFFELAPENWIQAGGKRRQELEYICANYTVVCHGLSLNIGGIAPLNLNFLKQLKVFMRNYGIPVYSEHLSYCGDEMQLYDLLPIPFTEDAVYYVSKRINQVQDFLEMPIAMENISYYLLAGASMSEIDFINAVLAETRCELLLDINNVHVNSINHHYDPIEFIDALKPNAISYLHIAGHHQESEDLIIDTHGEPVSDNVWDLLRHAYEHFGVLPTVLERDENLPAFSRLTDEIGIIKKMQEKFYA